MACRWIIAALILWLSAIPGLSRELGNESGVSGYIAELDRLSAAVESFRKRPQSVPEIIRRLPAEWTVRLENQTFQINTEYLKDGFEKLREKESDAALHLILARIAALKADAQAFQKSPEDASSSRNALRLILARREFKKVHGPTSWDALKKKLLLFVVRMLQRIFGSSAFPTVSKLLVWMLVVAAIMTLAILIFKAMQRNARLEATALESSPVSAKPWTAWMAEAHAAAAKGSWRDAIRLSYWAGISFLESRGLWHLDQARTPREYLRLLTSSSEYWSSLSALTRRFEAIWYGGAEAGPDSFSKALNNLESLGCRSN
jgi:hypothetical protein